MKVFEAFERRRVEIGGGVSINCVIGGSGPPVLLLHGFPQNLAMWARVAPLLAEAGFTTICADLRGYGDSAKPHCLADRSNYAFRAMAADQAALMNRLGFPRFHMVGHDRGGRTGHRMALDRPDAVLSLAVLDIVPTYAMFMDTNRHVAGAYWHWYFLSQPEPFPERVIGNDPDLFYETCLVGWGATRVEDFDPVMLADYRRCWRDPAMIHGSCSDYRAAATIDLDHDEADLDKRIRAPLLLLWGARGLVGRNFDVPASWRERAIALDGQALDCAHYLPEEKPDETAAALRLFFLS
jgi:haloacetate dehalogenase